MLIDEKKLINLDVTLAEVIRDHLLAFKKMKRHGVLYSKSGKHMDSDYDIKKHGDDTEWLLKELIWTFNTIALGGASRVPESEKMFTKIYKETLGEDLQNIQSINKLSKHSKYNKWKNNVQKTQERINNGLRLFSENFERLWD